MKVTVPKAQQKDIPALIQLYESFYQFHAGLQPRYYLPARESGVYPQSVLESKTGELLVAESGGVVVGFAHVEAAETLPYPSVAPHRFGTLVDLCVREGQRGKGVGGELLSAVKSWAAEKQLEYLELMVLENNSSAVGFYEKQGFIAKAHIMKLESLEGQHGQA